MRLNQKLDFHRNEIIEVEKHRLEDAQIGIFAYGSTSRSARRAVLLARNQGIKVGLLRPRVIWPFPDQEVLEMAKQVSHIIVPEMNLGQIGHEVEWASRFKAEVIKINRIDGEPIKPEEILAVINEIVGKQKN
jgi:2-oxoglutarate ferredoxin oxidoreductase subunit alpha